ETEDEPDGHDDGCASDDIAAELADNAGPVTEGLFDHADAGVDEVQGIEAEDGHDKADHEGNEDQLDDDRCRPTAEKALQRGTLFGLIVFKHRSLRLAGLGP